MLWFLISGGFAFWMISLPAFVNVNMAITATSFIIITLCCGTGAFIGNLIRKFTIPDGFVTSGGMSAIFYFKMFWLIGPQCIGFGIGVLFAEGVLNNFFDISLRG